MLDRLLAILQTCGTRESLLQPTQLFNEGWMLRLVLDWFSRQPADSHPLSFGPGARWFSEALLPLPFLARWRGDKLAESYTHADGAIGHFQIGGSGKGDLVLSANGTQLVVIEAKLFSALSHGVTNAPYFDQAARSVACIAEVLERAGWRDTERSSLGFYVIAPESQIDRGVFTQEVDRAGMLAKVRRRVAGYQGEKDRWFRESFLSAFERTNVDCLSWESILGQIEGKDPVSARSLRDFYRHCLKFNQPHGPIQP